VSIVGTGRVVIEKIIDSGKLDLDRARYGIRDEDSRPQPVPEPAGA